MMTKRNTLFSAMLYIQSGGTRYDRRNKTTFLKSANIMSLKIKNLLTTGT